MPPGGRGAADLCPVDRQTTGGCGGGSRVCERWRPDALGQPARAKWTPREPYAVKYWQIGNEVGGKDYERSIAAFARAMRAADPSIKLMSSYPRSGVLAGAEGQLDYLCPHHYETGDLTEVVREFESLRERIRLQGQGREVRIAVTEWNTTGGDFGLKRGILQSLGNALDCARYHNVLQRYADLVEMGIRSILIDSFGSGVIVTGPGWMYRAPTYYAEELYGRAAGSYPLSVERAGGLPWQLQQPDVSAALSADGRLLRIYGVNSTAAPLRSTIVLADTGKSVAGAKAFVLKNRAGLPNTEAMNSVSDREAVSVETHSFPALGNRFAFTFDQAAGWRLCQQKVVGFEVAMDHVLVMAIGQSFQRLQHDRRCLALGKLAATLPHQLTETAPTAILHDKIKRGSYGSVIKQDDDIGMAKLLGDFDFPQKIVPGFLAYHDFGQQHLDRHRASALLMRGQIDGTTSAFSQSLLNLIARHLRLRGASLNQPGLGEHLISLGWPNRTVVSLNQPLLAEHVIQQIGRIIFRLLAAIIANIVAATTLSQFGFDIFAALLAAQWLRTRMFQ